MSGLGRRGIGVSAYLQNLNTIPADEPPIDPFNPEDLELWAGALFDYDMGRATSDPTAQVREKPLVKQPASARIDPTLKEFDSFLNEFENFDYSPSFADYSRAGDQHRRSLPQAAHHPAPVVQQAPTQKPIAADSAPTYPAPPSASTPPVAAASPASPAAAHRGAKRKASTASPESLEEASRLAAEEDKRRRNTAASARFRVKKKQKEQQLERTAKEMTERVAQLESRIQQLQTENKWLKNLIVEKDGGKSGEELLMPCSIPSGNKDGVGTVGDSVKGEN